MNSNLATKARELSSRLEDDGAIQIVVANNTYNSVSAAMLLRENLKSQEINISIIEGYNEEIVHPAISIGGADASVVLNANSNSSLHSQTTDLVKKFLEERRAEKPFIDICSDKVRELEAVINLEIDDMYDYVEDGLFGRLSSSDMNFLDAIRRKHDEIIDEIIKMNALVVESKILEKEPIFIEFNSLIPYGLAKEVAHRVNMSSSLPLLGRFIDSGEVIVASAQKDEIVKTILSSGGVFKNNKLIVGDDYIKLTEENLKNSFGGDFSIQREQGDINYNMNCTPYSLQENISTMEKGVNFLITNYNIGAMENSRNGDLKILLKEKNGNGDVVVSADISISKDAIARGEPLLAKIENSEVHVSRAVYSVKSNASIISNIPVGYIPTRENKGHYVPKL